MSDMERAMEEKKRRGLKDCLTSWKVVLSMIMVQGFVTGMQLLSRVILVQGSFIFSLIAYRHIIAALCVAPFALYFERMTMAQGLFYYGLRDTSATYSANFLNMVPICTFLTSVIFRLEKLGLKSWTGRTKCAGAILCVGGALLTSLYKGKQFYLFHHSYHAHTAIAPHPTHMLRGTFLLISSCFSYTAWFLLQVQLLKVFPLRYWGTMLSCVIAAIQAAIVGVCIDSSKAAWRLEWNLQLVTIIYSGALATAATFCILSWAITIKGPTYPSMFNPLSLIFVAFSEALVIGQPLTFGTLLGMVLIIVGLYSFLWGKSNEKKGITQQPIVAAAEVSNISDLIAGAESTATVVPSSSPLNTLDLQHDAPHKN
ncbi:WAT1-related protein At5g64700 isoform X2 [Vigna radiata var. radiata]|uniref:WAT1-related protein n=1 Tax=Vigna radiata var. radiata TaxID=3916 RepID=A0A3Q0F2U9_VIGRR|nr:WAT1-related protein At5g64700 isoform X2 [Vigna radiata var. radiata]